MRTIIYLSLAFLFCGCYATHSRVASGLGSNYVNKESKKNTIENILIFFNYDSLDYRVYYGMRNDPDMLSRTSLFYQIQNYLHDQLDSIFPLSKKDFPKSTENKLDIFEDIFLFNGRRFRKKYTFEFHRSPYWPIYTRFDSVWVSPNYSHLRNTLITEFKLLKMYRDGRGSVPGFSANIQLRFGYIGDNEVIVYRNFLAITTKAIDGGVFRRLGNENIDWWRPRHIEELVKRMQYELGLTDKKGRPVGN